MDLLAGLNPQQREAVLHTDGALLILAGAGSGKTRVITHRMANLIANHGVAGSSILAVTFTNKAAGEMKERVQSLVREVAGRAAGPMVSTFHSFCVRLLRQDGDGLAAVRPGFTRNFTIYDDDDQLAVVKSVYKQLGLDENFMKYRGALSAISQAKNQKRTPADFYKDANPKSEKLAVIFEHYESRLKQANSLDFDDLLLESVRLLRTHQPTRENWNRRLQYLLVDEYQDTNRTQYDLVRLLSVGHSNVCVVGDEDQSIYGWRGADIRNILDFESDYPRAKVIRLEQNYRSTGSILKSASAVVARNKQRKGKNLWTSAGDGDRIGLYEAPDGENEALWIADTIEAHLRRDPQTRAAVLYRTNSQSRQIEEALRRYNRKYTVVGGFSFYQRAEVKDALAYLKVLLSPADSISLLRIINTPARGIGRTTLDQIEQFALARELSLWSAIRVMLDERQFSGRAEAALSAFVRMMNAIREDIEQGPEKVLRRVMDESGYWKTIEEDRSTESEGRLQNLSELVNAAAEASERGETLAEFLDHAALVADADSVDEQSQISLLTMHNAKGLEFPIVFVAGMEEGLFPHSRARDSEEALEEERRLCYVAMTRAERRLYLSYARYRRRFGAGLPEATIPSRFIGEVPVHLLEVLSVGVRGAASVDLFGEQSYVRESVKKNYFTGKTYNSIENIAQFFQDRGVRVPATMKPPPDSPPPAAPAAADLIPPRIATPKPVTAPPPAKRPPAGLRSGSVVQHAKFGRGTIVRVEGDGEEAKLTISFAGHGLKKMVRKFAGITIVSV
jgi:DNA helicase-2/ATP-dependent DNA helicase PcrA